MARWDGDDYQATFDRLVAEGHDVHGEADLVMVHRPASVLDAGCGTGRVAIELARRGVSVVGVDRSPEMLRTARDRAPDLEWVEADLTELDLRAVDGGRRSFSLVVMAGNVMLFTDDPPATVAGCARHLAPAGTLVAGFQVAATTTPSGHRSSGLALDDYDAACEDAGLVLVERLATWDGAPYRGGGYAVSIHRSVA